MIPSRQADELRMPGFVPAENTWSKLSDERRQPSAIRLRHDIPVQRMSTDLFLVIRQWIEIYD